MRSEFSFFYELLIFFWIPSFCSGSIKNSQINYEVILKEFAMTRLGIITQFLSKMSNQSENDLLAWARDNIDPGVLSKLKEEVSHDEISALVNELEKSPEAFLSLLVRQLSWDNTRTRPSQVHSSAVEATVL